MRVFTQEHRRKLSEAKKGKSSNNKGQYHYWLEGSRNKLWKKKPGYRTIHQWINRHREKTGECQLCFRTDKRTQWANLSREYRRDVYDWVELCASCNGLADSNKFWL